MDAKSPNRTSIQTDVFSALDRAYGLVDGSTCWSDCLEALVDLAELRGCSLFLYDCSRSQSQLIETRGDGGKETGSANDVTLDDVLWRSTLGTIWSPHGKARGDVASAMAKRVGNRHAEGYTVVDRDQTHILYLAFSGARPGQRLARDIEALLESVLTHVHRACRLQRSVQAKTLSQLVNPDRPSALGPTSLPVEMRLRRRFRLSKAEARVAKLLAEGLAPRIIADRLHVSIHTVRSQLQSIFQKTDTCRQAELTSLLLRETEIPTSICRTPPISIEREGRGPCL